MDVTLIVPDGVGVRNFVLGAFAQRIAGTGRLSVLHDCPREHVEGLLQRTSALETAPLLPWRETPASFTIRYALSYAHMYWANTRSMRFNRRLPVRGSWRAKAAGVAARITGRAAASSAGIRTLERALFAIAERTPEMNHYRGLFERLRPSVVFCSHQRPSSVVVPALAARSLGIPTATFIFSWDNLTSKGRIAAPFDHYFVWSERMKGELHQYYPDVRPEQVHIVGTPQFEPYGCKELLWGREEFFQRIGGDASRPLICYSGGDAGNCPEDPDHAADLLKLIRGGRIKSNPQVLLRPSPADESARYEKVRAQFGELIFAAPLWVHTERGNWARSMPTCDDVQLLANIAHYADLNVNVASTMTLDFAIHDTPVVNIAYNIADPPPFGIPLWNAFYEFDHYRPVVELGAARFARSATELAEHVNSYLANPALDAEARRRLVAMQIASPLSASTSRTISALESIVQ